MWIIGNGIWNWYYTTHTLYLYVNQFTNNITAGFEMKGGDNRKRVIGKEGLTRLKY